MWASDHRPTVIKFASEADSPSKGRFYFDQRMSNREGVEEIVKQSWAELQWDGNVTVMDRIQRCRAAPSGCKNSVGFHSVNRIQCLKCSLENKISKSSPYPNVVRDIKHKLAEVYKEEELFWKQRRKEQWLKTGDKNTKFFTTRLRT